ncbi:MAG TPA: ATP synthase F1 subunit delta [Chloroflexota bacterium]|nr:ATP synthase F1 subunit delta [Chloroflexota bacterium]
MLRGTSARRYAESVFAIAKDQNSFDRWLEDLSTVHNVFANPEMARLLADPKPSVADKEAVIEKVLAGKVDKLALNTALLLVRREQASTAGDLERDFREMVNNYRNVAVAEVTVAVDLDPGQQQMVKERLERLTAKTIELKTKVDKSILGGFVARVGDVLIDASLATKLQNMRQELLTRTT